jgi:hypothetical protein
VRVALGREFYQMFRWFNAGGFQADVAALRRNYPQLRLRTLEDWLREDGWAGKRTVTEPMSEKQARNVGVLAGRSDHDDIVDVCVVEGAIRRGDAVVTSNAAHIRKVAGAVGARLRIESI